MDPRMIDKRVAKRNMDNGKISKEDYDKYLAALPDMAADAEPVKEKLFGDLDEEEETTENEDSATENEK
jgi:hypothetical protein